MTLVSLLAFAATDAQGARPATPSNVQVTPTIQGLKVDWDWTDDTGGVCNLSDSEYSGYGLNYRKTGLPWRQSQDLGAAPNDVDNGAFELYDKNYPTTFTVDADAVDIIGPTPNRGVALDPTEYEVRVFAFSQACNPPPDGTGDPDNQPWSLFSDVGRGTAVADLTPTLTLTGSIADQELTQDMAYTSATAFPEATGGNLPIAYSVDSLPDGITLNSARKLTGTAIAPRAKSSLTYVATDVDGDAPTLTFNMSVAPQKPANFTATAGDTEVTLAWTAIAGVTGLEYQQDSGTWTAISGSDATTASHTVTGLTNGTEYSFKVRAHVGSGNTLVTGVESDAESATPSADLVPALPAVADQLYVQGTEVAFTLPAATGGDGHPNYAYTLTPNVSGAGLTFTASTRKLGGTPSTPKAKVSYTYTATESSDADGAKESANKTFTIGIQPQKPANFTATAGNTQVTLAWTAIAGVTKWQYQQGSDSWTDITGSSATTASHTVTGLTNDTAYTFKVRALVGTGNTLVNGVESDAVTATPSVDKDPDEPPSPVPALPLPALGLLWAALALGGRLALRRGMS